MVDLGENFKMKDGNRAFFNKHQTIFLIVSLVICDYFHKIIDSRLLIIGGSILWTFSMLCYPYMCFSTAFQFIFDLFILSCVHYTSNSCFEQFFNYSLLIHICHRFEKKSISFYISTIVFTLRCFSLKNDIIALSSFLLLSIVIVFRFFLGVKLYIPTIRCSKIHELFIASLLPTLLGNKISPRTFLYMLSFYIPENISICDKVCMTSQSRRLIAFFTLNFTFMFAEFIVGFSTNSLGLISDAFHMLCDNISLFVSILASIVSKWSSNKQFSYGFSRVEVVCSFSNATLLFFIAYNLFNESISRLIDPPKIGSENLVLVSVLGLVVNLMGLLFVGGDDNGKDGEDKNVFMQSIYLHILVDALGSVAVIISSVFVVVFDVYILDPICSLFIVISISYSTIGIMKDAMKVLNQTSGSSDTDIISKLKALGRIVNFHWWETNQGIPVITCEIDNVTKTIQQSVLEEAIDELNSESFRNVCVEIRL